MDAFCKRYGWTVDEFLDTEEWRIQELEQVIQAQQDYELEEQARSEEDAERARKGLPAIPRPKRNKIRRQQIESETTDYDGLAAQGLFVPREVREANN